MKNSVDKKFETIGFEKNYENSYGASYIRENYGFNFVQRIDIMRKYSGRNMIMSYQAKANKDGFNNVVGLTYEETKLCMKKYRQLERKYKWRRIGNQHGK